MTEQQNILMMPLLWMQKGITEEFGDKLVPMVHCLPQILSDCLRLNMGLHGMKLATHFLRDDSV